MNIRRLIITFVGLTMACSLFAQTDAYIKLFDHHGQHPRILSITYPGDANLLDMYNSIYGHGAVIENPWVAYRVYMDNRQSLDLYVKQNPQIELDVTGFYTTPEQLTQGYGCDVLWAGKSIAAGSFRGWQNNTPVTIDSVMSRTQTVLSPSSVQIVDNDWFFNGHPINMTQTYSVTPDSRDLFVTIKLEGYLPEDIFATGIQKLETDNIGFISEKGYAASWGSNIPDKNQPEWTEQVGLGIVVNSENIIKAVEDELNYIFLVKPDQHGVISYRVISCGDRESDGFKSADKWLEYINKLNK